MSEWLVAGRPMPPPWEPNDAFVVVVGAVRAVGVAAVVYFICEVCMVG